MCNWWQLYVLSMRGRILLVSYLRFTPEFPFIGSDVVLEVRPWPQGASRPNVYGRGLKTYGLGITFKLRSITDFLVFYYVLYYICAVGSVIWF